MRGGSLQLAGGGDPVVAPPQPRRTFKPVAVLPSAHCPLKTVSDEACLPSAGAGPCTPTYPGPKEGRSQVGWGSSRSSLSRRSHPGGCQLWVPAAGSSLSPVVASQGPSAGLSPSWPPIALPCPHPPQGGVHPEPSFRLPGARSQGSAQPLLGPAPARPRPFPLGGSQPRPPCNSCHDPCAHRGPSPPSSRPLILTRSPLVSEPGSHTAPPCCPAPHTPPCSPAPPHPSQPPAPLGLAPPGSPTWSPAAGPPGTCPEASSPSGSDPAPMPPPARPSAPCPPLPVALAGLLRLSPRGPQAACAQGGGPRAEQAPAPPAP